MNNLTTRLGDYIYPYPVGTILRYHHFDHKHVVCQWKQIDDKLFIICEYKLISNNALRKIMEVFDAEVWQVWK